VRLHRRPCRDSGFTAVVTPGHELEHVGLGLLRMQPNESYTARTDGYEAALVILSGVCDVAGPGFAYVGIGGRASVFEGEAHTVYVPSGSAYTVTAVTPLEVAVGTAPCPAAHGEARLISPDDVVVNQRGKPGFSRVVKDLIDGRTPAQRLLVGETISGAGDWSSYPPHKHDESNPGVECQMEEIYYFRVNPEQGFGVQVWYSRDGAQEEACVVRDGDVTLLPNGYHPVAAAPGYRLYYLWVMSGEGRQMLPFDDSAHAWVKGAS